jgi:type IV pilus assembly protein PilY1
MITLQNSRTKPNSWSFNISSLAYLFSTIINSSFILFLAFAALPSQVLSAGTPPTIPKTSLASSPPYAEQTGDKPTAVLGLSVEYPSVGALYKNPSISYCSHPFLPECLNDFSYSNSTEYIGYFDTESCYTYILNPTETLNQGQTLEDFKRFQRSDSATDRMCSNAFSGNFLNWASSSAIDAFRLALTGGDRLIDRENLTILQRAILPDNSHTTPPCFMNSPMFPAKKLSKAGGTSGSDYFGAVPKAMQTTAGNNDIWVGNMLNQIFFSNINVGSWACNSAQNFNLGKYYARVEVCNSNSGILQDNRNYQLCKKYPSGHYKPIGALQKYSDNLRVSVFGFLLDKTASWNNGRYGGVLRAPMKYIGQKTFDESGVENTPSNGNPKAEWDNRSGIFKPNPESHAYGISGVINYINKFGRTGSTPGNYKQFDPIGELHYEALRYLQGLQPSPAAISNIAPGMDDGFPVYTQWTDDPFGDRSNTANYSCLKSNILMFGDTNTNDGNRLPTFNAAKNIPDIDKWTKVVQSFEKDTNISYIDGQGITQTTNNPNPGNPDVNDKPKEKQIMGTAYWANTHDIRGTQWDDEEKRRPGLRVKTFTFDVNEFGQQNNSDTMKKTNQLFTAAKYGGFATDSYSSNNASYNTEGNPFYRDDGTPDPSIWQDTNPSPLRMGMPKTYFKQENGMSVITSMDEIFRRFSTSRQIIAGAATQSKTLTSGGNYLYLGSFHTEKWSGDVVARRVVVDPNNPTSVTIQTTPSWSANDKLNLLQDPVNERKIVVGKSVATQSDAATDFKWSAIDQNLKDALSKATPSSPPDSLGPDRLNYLRGDRSQESSVFRSRAGLLGDIINSGLVYSGAPTTKIMDDDYPTFQVATASRTPAVFVGANDGMLHAFNANNGSELFAYIPSWIAPKLPALAQLDYDDNHQSFVDSTPEVAEAKVSGVWKTVLVSGTGNGGRGVFALDVSNPSVFNPSKVMWEFTQKDDPDMGNVVGTPRILKFCTSGSQPCPTYKWFAVVASGVNNYVADSSGTFGSGYPALFLLDLSKDKGTLWEKDTNYYKISIPVNGNLDYINTYSQTGGTALSVTQATGLVNFSYALGAAREVNYIFMGDLHGQLWKLDFTEVESRNWNIDRLSFFSGSGSKPIPLYVAKDSSGNAQPITAPPMIANGPLPKSYYVLFGTGSYLTASDQFLTTPQSVYMVYDNAKKDADTTSAPVSAISGRNRLKLGTASGGSVSVPPFKLGRAATNLDSESIRSGWYFDLPSSGERMISSMIFSGETAIFSSMIPITQNTVDQCFPDNGSGKTYEVKFADGAGSFTVSTVGLMGLPVQFNLTDATTYLGANQKTNNTGRRVRVTPTKKIQIGTLGTSVFDGQDKKEVTGRLNWRQINNFQYLKNSP